MQGDSTFDTKYLLGQDSSTSQNPTGTPTPTTRDCAEVVSPVLERYVPWRSSKLRGRGSEGFFRICWGRLQKVFIGLSIGLKRTSWSLQKVKALKGFEQRVNYVLSYKCFTRLLGGSHTQSRPLFISINSLLSHKEFDLATYHHNAFAGGGFWSCLQVSWV